MTDLQTDLALVLWEAGGGWGKVEDHADVKRNECWLFGWNDRVMVGPIPAHVLISDPDRVKVEVGRTLAGWVDARKVDGPVRLVIDPEVWEQTATRHPTSGV